jgi:hypothetical protein
MPVCPYQGCQMVYFQAKKPNLGEFWDPWNGKYWYILGPFGMYNCRLGHFGIFSPRFGILYHEKSGNPGPNAFRLRSTERKSSDFLWVINSRTNSWRDLANFPRPRPPHKVRATRAPAHAQDMKRIIGKEIFRRRRKFANSLEMGSPYILTYIRTNSMPHKQRCSTYSDGY